MTRADHATMNRRVRVAEVLLASIVVLGAILVGHQIVAGPLLARPFTVVVELPDAAGLHKRSDVSYRGQHVGTVSAVQLTSDGVRVTMKINDGVRIPVATDVKVANLSAVGEQYVDFRPTSDSGPYLGDGAVIEAGRDSLPVPTWHVLDHTRRLLERVDVRDLATIAREINAVFGDGDVDLPGVAAEVGRTVSMLERLSPKVVALLDEAETPLRTMKDLDPELRAFARSAREITAQLRKSNPTIARLIDQGNTLVPVLTNEFDGIEPVLVKLLDDGTPVATMARKHLPGLLHWYRWGPRQMVAMADATRDDSAHVILVFTIPQNCRYGGDVSPYQREYKPPVKARCTTVDPKVQQRGSQYAPHP